MSSSFVPIVTDNAGDDSQGFARGQHTDYGTLPKPITTAHPAHTGLLFIRLPLKHIMFRSFAVLIVLLFTLHIALKYPYDVVRQKLEREQSEVRWRWREEMLEHESETRRWEAERAANQSLARLDWHREELAQESVREGWHRERHEWELENEHIKERWARERQQWNVERKEWENEKSRYFPYFEEPALRDPHCRAFNTREYQARLWNIRLPGDNRWLEACMATKVNIHGKTYKSPDWCADQVCISPLLILNGYFSVTDSQSPFVPLLDSYD